MTGELLREGAAPKKPLLEGADLLAGWLLLAGDDVLLGRAGADPKKPPPEACAPAAALPLDPLPEGNMTFFRTDFGQLTAKGMLHGKL